MASDVYQQAKRKIGDQTLDVAGDPDIVLILVSDSYTFDETQDALDTGTDADVTSNELDADGYAAGYNAADRKTPASRQFVRNDSNSRVEFDFDDVTFSSLGGGVSANNDQVGGVVLALEGPTDDTDSIPIVYDELQDNRATNGSDVTYSPSDEGMFQLQ